ncbi:MFS transporter [Actinopolymorpha sp. B17G11]|uniref:MFS transporter n=1 Tax=Actinopolymorpha sp. B17G11 TaxID=3160861 RepID=UPI0032E4BB6C
MTVTRPRRRAPLAALMGANLVSTVGGAMSLVALPWFVFQTTGDTALTGIAATCEFLAVAAASLFAGSVIRHLGPRGTRVISDVVAGLAVLAVPVLHVTTGIAYPLLLVLVAVNGLLRTPAVAASMVMLAQTARLAETTTETVSGPYLASLELAKVIGVPLAGATIALVGAPWALVVDAATFLVSGLAIQLFLPAERQPRQDHRPSLLSAAQVLRADRVLVRLITIMLALAVAMSGWNSVLAPVYGQTVLHSAPQLAAILTASGIGAIAGSSLAGILGPRLDRRLLMATAVLLALVPPFILIASQAPVPAVVGAMLTAGFGSGLFSATFTTIEYERIPPADQGHVFGLVGGIGTAGIAVGPLLAGALLTVAPLSVGAVAIATVGATAAAALALTPGLRRSPPLQ